MAKATELRNKEAAAYAKESSDLNTNIAALAKATAAIEKGATGFLQSNAANIVRTLAMEKATLPDASREELLSFLSGTQAEGYVPQSGEIVGILKTMHDEMSAGLADATAAEEAAIQTYDALMNAKKKEVAALSAQIEAEIKRIGELGVELAGMANDLEETKEAHAEDTKFLAELTKGCDTKAAEYEEMKKTRAEELVALSETIKVLNDDDALELFKKTLPGASASFVQMVGGAASVRSRAISILRKPARTELDLIALALNGKQQGFEKVTKMIDEMVGNLKREQEEDDAKRTYCNEEFDKTDDKKKGLEQNIADSETAIEELEGAIATLRDENAGLEAGIAALDKSVAEATEQRKEEHAEYTSLMANDGAAKEVLGWAKNRLNKFYNPKLYVAPPKRDLSEEDRITVNMGGTLAPTQPPGGIAGTGISALAQVAPAPPPSIGTYGKKSQEGNGVIAMIDLLVKDLTKEMTEAEVTEKDAQSDYEKLMSESAEKRAQDSKAIVDKTASKANAEEALQAEEDGKASTSKELGLTLEAIHALHGECDWLLKYFDARKEARAGEVNALENAKAVLAGADYSLVQVERHGTSTCPSSSITVSNGNDAAGTPIFGEKHIVAPDTCFPTCAKSKAGDTQIIRLCGPGTWTLSRMSCDRHDYKAVTIEHPTSEFTASDCKEYKTADYYQIAGSIGSVSLKCSATAR
jgi:chromosome segregation ATPase